jgi:hypothetical protein
VASPILTEVARRCAAGGSEVVLQDVAGAAAEFARIERGFIGMFRRAGGQIAELMPNVE